MDCKVKRMRRRRRIVAGVAFVAVATAVTSALGQIGEPVLKGKIDEEFSQRVPSSSNSSVVGAVLGENYYPLELSKLTARLPPNVKASQLCFSATTSDGVYSASGRLSTTTGGPPGFARIDAQPFSKYARQLANYPQGTFTGMVTTAADCLDDTRKAVILPLAFEQGRKTLVVAINSASARSLTATLRWGKRPAEQIDSVCSKVRAAKTAFDLTCQFDMTRLTVDRPVELLIDKQPLNGPAREERYLIQPGA